jgi:hypothetical protein
MEVLISVETFEDGENVREINSPRSLEACLRAGLDPSELYPKPKSRFKSKKLNEDMIEAKYDHFEKKRKEKISIVKMERHLIIQHAERHARIMGNTSAESVMNDARESAAKASAAIEMEERRVEALKKRQEKEMAKMVEREQATAALQLKIKHAEEEDLRKRKQHDKKVQEQRAEAAKKNAQRLVEIAEADKQEQEKKREIARKEQEFDEKRKIAAMKAERQRAKDARARDEERTAKIEEYRRKTDVLIQAQVQLAEDNRLKMLEREVRVQNQLTIKKELKKEEVRQSKEKATLRIAEALDKHHELHEEKKRKFYEKQKEATVRAAEARVVEIDRLKKQADERDKKEKMRWNRLVDAYKTRADHRDDIVNRRTERNKTYAIVSAERHEKLAMMKFEADMRMHDKIENVERVARMNEFKRLQTLRKIEDNEDRYEMIQAQRQNLLDKRREEMKYAMLRKHEVNEIMDLMRITNDFTLLAKLSVKKAKPATAHGKGDKDDGDEDARLNQTQ